jgi:hypothetical protein
MARHLERSHDTIKGNLGSCAATTWNSVRFGTAVAGGPRAPCLAGIASGLRAVFLLGRACRALVMPRRDSGAGPTGNLPPATATAVADPSGGHSDLLRTRSQVW